MTNPSSQHGLVTVSDERLAILETELSHMKGSVSSINNTLSEVQKTNASIEKTLVELSAITKSNSLLRAEKEKDNDLIHKRINSSNERIGRLERWFYTWVGITLSISTIFSIFGAEIKAALFK